MPVLYLVEIAIREGRRARDGAWRVSLPSFSSLSSAATLTLLHLARLHRRRRVPV